MGENRSWFCKCLPSLKGLAYLSAANFLSRLPSFVDRLVNSFFTYEMVLLYGAHLDTHILLFFRAVFMVPIALLGLLVFCGIEKASFNLVLYPTLMLMFIVLLRYGAEVALLIIHWAEHGMSNGPSLVIFMTLDLLAVSLLLLYVYVCLAAPPLPMATMTPSRLNSLRRRLQRLSSLNMNNVDVEGQRAVIVGETKKNKKKAAAPPPAGNDEEAEALIPPPRPPPSPKFNYKARRNVDHLDKKDEKVVAQVEEVEKTKRKIVALPPKNNEVIEVTDADSKKQEGKKVTDPKLKKKDEVIDIDSEKNVEDEEVLLRNKKKQSLKVYRKEPKRRSLLIETDLDLEKPKSSEERKQESDSKNRLSKSSVEIEGEKEKVPEPAPEEEKVVLKCTGRVLRYSVEIDSPLTKEDKPEDVPVVDDKTEQEKPDNVIISEPDKKESNEDDEWEWEYEEDEDVKADGETQEEKDISDDKVKMPEEEEGEIEEQEIVTEDGTLFKFKSTAV